MKKAAMPVKAVTALARFFRISLSRGKTVIPVSDEVEHVRNYLMIQEMRFKNKFIYQFDVKEETKQLGTVKLILQPLVENAIYHAMEFMDDDGELTVKGYLEGEELVLSVTDNGCGMTKERAEALLLGDFVQTGKGSGVGLRNVQERIQLVFGEKYGLRILSEPDEGTCVEIHLPAIPYEEMKERGMVS
ncbi:MAG: ATP-binding protein [Anaerotignum sp.]